MLVWFLSIHWTVFLREIRSARKGTLPLDGVSMGEGRVGVIVPQ
jgi:hypothetical protein